MAYIGKQPTVGNFVKLDAITTSATTTFNLLNGGVAYYPQSPNHCLVSLNGILQAPTDSFTISGSTIIFSSALTTSDVIDFIIVLGDVLNIGTPSDATVGFSKITSNLITGATAETAIADADTLLIYDDSATALRKMTKSNLFSGIANTPAFYAYKSSSQTITSGVITKIDFGTEDFDTNNNFASSRFTPTTAGKYYIETGLTFQGGTNFLIDARIYIYKNGSSHTLSYWANQNNYGNYNSRTWSSIIDMNGSSDYVEIYANSSNSTTNTTMSSGRDCWFQGFKLIGV